MCWRLSLTDLVVLSAGSFADAAHVECMTDILVPTVAGFDPETVEAFEHAKFELARANAAIGCYAKSMVVGYVRARFPDAVEIDCQFDRGHTLQFINVVDVDDVTLMPDLEEDDVACIDTELMNEVIKDLDDVLATWLDVNPNEDDAFLTWKITSS